MIELNCPNCGEEIEVNVESDSGAGCPECGEDYAVEFDTTVDGAPVAYLVALEVST